MPNPELELRSFSHQDPADREFVSQLSREAFSEFSLNAPSTTLHMATHEASWIALESGTRVGLAVCVIQPSELAELCAIAVIARERGRGIGRALLSHAERATRARGAPGMLLHTATANVAALDLFLRNGYRIRRRLPRYYRNVYEACELVKHWRRI
ncbi:MAG TPA: N-acetyltransferase [Polyangiaceae bacterium]|nr:N-acetyltransferase [Polyangiaceae bacterium]